MVLSEITEFFGILIVALLLLMLVVRVLKTHWKSPANTSFHDKVPDPKQHGASVMAKNASSEAAPSGSTDNDSGTADTGAEDAS